MFKERSDHSLLGLLAGGQYGLNLVGLNGHPLPIEDIEAY